MNTSRLVSNLVVLCSSATALMAERSVMPLQTGWFFQKGPATPSASIDQWERVTVPHTWNAVDVLEGRREIRTSLQTPEEAKADAAARKAARPKPESFSMQDGYYRGVGWYARNLDIPAEWKGNRRVFVRFEAASMVARTYINQRLLGEHRGGFTAFCYELTDFLEYGGTNQLRVEVDNSWRDDLCPLFIDVSIQGGLYRPAELIVTDRLAISPLDFASPGVYVRTAALHADRAEIEVRTIISNGHKPVTGGTGPLPSEVTVRTEIKDASGAVAATQTSVRQVRPETTGSATQTLRIASPHLWNGVKDPYLYRVDVSLLSGSESGSAVLDKVTVPLGVRTLGLNGKDFLLNGKPYPVHGVNRHQDKRGNGWALTPEDHEQDMRLMLEMGVTAVRNAHYPQSAYWHELADRHGVVLWDEVSNVDAVRSTRAYWLNTEEQLREMVLQLYNHPSVAWWGVFNELANKPVPPCKPEFEQLLAVLKSLDPDRPSIGATNRRGYEISSLPDQMGINVYPGWYPYATFFQGSPATMQKLLDVFFTDLGRNFCVSEYGAGADIAHHTEGEPVGPEKTDAPFHPEEWQAHVHEQAWEAISRHPQAWGSFVWNMFDFSSYVRDEGGTPRLNDKGLVTHDRKIRKDAYFFYKAHWNPEPMVYITSRRATVRKQAVTGVKVYSNCAEVELKVNGKSHGKKTPDANRMVQWPDVQLRPGKNLIEAQTSAKGSPVADSCEWELVSGTSPGAK